ncbi:MAG: SUMF1/EgtB/PvdO family nonheme iron enzyme [Planctomycetes bacterium]|nr:SUMF1/EgtB/PvdO family nonheme iron enzyme [Planctomycetota bacterium]
MESLNDALSDVEVIELIALGGMGAVYKSRQRKLDRAVALKILPPQQASDPERQERFERECRTLAKLNHPNIVTIYNAGRVEGFPYLIMEYIEGASLRELLVEGSPSAEEVLRLIPQICAAMQYAHDSGIVHRDIKPENILVDVNGNAKVADFGIAKLATEPESDSITLTETGVRMGTARYMAPEQVADTAGVDHRADIYSLGIMFYEMLTGRLPTADWKAPSLETDIDKRIDQVIQRSIKEAPEERYQQAQEVHHELEQISSAAPQAGGWVVTCVGLLIACVISLVAFFWIKSIFGVPTLSPTQVTRTNPPPSSAMLPFDAAQAASLQQKWAAHLGVEAETTNSLGMRLQFIPPGDFSVTPEFTARITRPYYVGTHEVTVAQFREFVDATQYLTTVEQSGTGGIVGEWNDEPKPEHTWKHETAAHGDDYPVGQISWHDAVAFCKWLSDRERTSYRLPTEAEWEWACRAGSSSKYSFGDDSEELSEFAWFDSNSDGQAQPVGLKSPNNWGLQDMLGNITEYCHDWWGLYPAGTLVDPQGAPAGGLRVARGSSFKGGPDFLACGARFRSDPQLPMNRFGFRVVCEIPAVSGE